MRYSYFVTASSSPPRLPTIWVTVKELRKEPSQTYVVTCPSSSVTCDRSPEPGGGLAATWTKAREKLAGGPGFEPRLTESESAVLPLNYPPTGAWAKRDGFLANRIARRKRFAAAMDENGKPVALEPMPGANVANSP